MQVSRLYLGDLIDCKVCNLISFLDTSIICEEEHGTVGKETPNLNEPQFADIEDVPSALVALGNSTKAVSATSAKQLKEIPYKSSQPIRILGASVSNRVRSTARSRLPTFGRGDAGQG